MAIKVLVIVDNYRYADFFRHILDWNQLGVEIVGVEYNGALALEQFQLFEPEIVIMDTLVPIIGVDKFVQLMQGFTNDFVVILLDDSGETISNNIQHVYKTLKKSRLDAKTLSETLKNAINLLKKDSEETTPPQHRERIQTLTSALGDGNFAMDNLYKLRNEQSLNLSATLHILLPRPAQKISSIPDALVFELSDILDKYCGGEVIVMRDGTLCILLNDIQSNAEFSAESRYEQLLYEIRWSLGKYFKPHFSFFLSKSIQLTALTAKYADLRNAYEVGYFLREVKIVNSSFPLKPAKTNNDTTFDSTILELANHLIRNAPSSFESLFRDVYLNKLKQQMNFQAVDLFRFKLELLAQVVTKIFPGVIQAASPDLYKQTYQSIEDEFEALNDFFKDLFRQIGSNQSPMNVLVFNALVQVINHFQEAISLSSIAKSITVTPTYLSHLFTKELGINFSDHLAEVRILRAKRLMMNESVKINEVARDAGFSDYRYFSQVFRKITGLTPSEYRLRMSVAQDGLAASNPERIDTPT